MKKFFVGIFAGAILATSVTAMAAPGLLKNINASYSINKLIVNGRDTGKGSTAFISEGTTYVPLRTVSDALGSDIKWDPSTKNIYINSNGGNALEQPTDLPVINQPATLPANQPVTLPANPPINNQKFIGEAKAKQIAVQKFGGQVISCVPDLYDNDWDDAPSYEVKIRNGYRICEIDIDATTGAIISFDWDD